MKLSSCVCSLFMPLLLRWKRKWYVKSAEKERSANMPGWVGHGVSSMLATSGELQAVMHNIINTTYINAAYAHLQICQWHLWDSLYPLLVFSMLACSELTQCGAGTSKCRSVWQNPRVTQHELLLSDKTTPEGITVKEERCDLHCFYQLKVTFESAPRPHEGQIASKAQQLSLGLQRRERSFNVSGGVENWEKWVNVADEDI